MEITQEQLKEKIQNGENLVVDFWAPWCGPCRVVKPLFEKVSSEVNTQMFTMNVDNNKEMAIELGIRSIPTIKSFSGGKVIDTYTGIISETQLKNLAENLING